MKCMICALVDVIYENTFILRLKAAEGIQPKLIPKVNWCLGSDPTV